MIRPIITSLYGVWCSVGAYNELLRVWGMSENANINVPCQFNHLYTYYACGFFCYSEILHMTKPGVANTTPLNTIFMEAMHKYRLYNGANGPSDTTGMSDAQTRQIQREYGISAVNIGSTSNAHNTIVSAIKAGKVVQVAITEVSAYDYGLGRNPYTDWNPAGIHAIIINGIDANQNYIVRDSANCTGWILRSQPRIYSWQRLNIVNGYIITPKWSIKPIDVLCETSGKGTL